MLIRRLHNYLLEEARSRGNNEYTLGTWTGFINEHSDDWNSNIAFPRWPPVPPINNAIEELRMFFKDHERRLHAAYLHDYAPHLAALLPTNNLHVFKTEPIWVCTPGTLQAVGLDQSIKIKELTSRSSTELLQEHLWISAHRYSNHVEPMLKEVAETLRPHLNQGRAFTMYRNGQAIGAGMFTTPRHELSQVQGVHILEAYRDNLDGRMLIEAIAEAAFEHGCDAVFSTEAQADLVMYEQLGWSKHTVLLHIAEVE